MGKIITIDPITRIEGHLKIDIEVSGGKITNAWSSGTMYRGIEQILVGRDPREAWLFTQRFCGVCTTVHAIASVRAVENALDLEIPVNAQLIRNLIIASHSIFDHIVHFYHLSALDYVDVVSATKAKAKDAADFAQLISPGWHRNTTAEMQAVKDRVIAVVKSGQLGIFNNGYWGHKAMELPPKVNLMAVAHYLQALEYQRKINECVGLLGGKTPHIQNLAVGGVANAIDLDEQTSMNMTTLLKVKSYFDEIKSFVNDVYLTDVCAVGTVYVGQTAYGKGVADYLAVPEFPIDGKGTDFSKGISGGTIIDGKVKAITSYQDKYFEDNVSESIARSYYDGDWNKHPYKESTDPQVSDYDRNGKYSWCKAPRFQGKPMQVGPLANVLSSFMLGDKRTAKYATIALEKINLFGKVLGISTAANLDVNGLVGALQSSLGRNAARAVRCACITEMALDHWALLVDNISKGDKENFNKPVFPKGEQQGFGYHEAPRGTLSHWIIIKDGKIKNFQAVVPSTWNAGPRDEKDQKGPYEASLIGNNIADEKRPLEALRVIHSFDPCLACAVHAFDPEGNEIGTANTNI